MMSRFFLIMGALAAVLALVGLADFLVLAFLAWVVLFDFFVEKGLAQGPLQWEHR